jgi:hypothetical protein
MIKPNRKLILVCIVTAVIVVSTSVLLCNYTNQSDETRVPSSVYQNQISLTDYLSTKDVIDAHKGFMGDGILVYRYDGTDIYHAIQCRNLFIGPGISCCREGIVDFEDNSFDWISVESEIGMCNNIALVNHREGMTTSEAEERGFISDVKDKI